MNKEHRIALFSCSASRDFALRVIDAVNNIRSASEPEYRLGLSELSRFSDGEFQPAFTESV